MTWTRQTEHTGSFNRQAENTGIFTRRPKTNPGVDIFLLMEDGGFLLQQDGFKIMISRKTHWDNLPEHG